jgi:Mg-chelatase subunit ChlD
VFKGSKAFTIQQPTRNLELIVKKLKNMGASDFTPLPAGLLQSLKILKQEKMVNKDAVPHIIVISDGIVNVPLDIPISPLTRRKYLSEAQADSFDVAHLLSKEKIKVHIVNTNHSRSDEKSFPVIDPRKRVRFTPTQFMIELARLSGGNYKGLNPVTQSIEKDKEFIYH